MTGRVPAAVSERARALAAAERASLSSVLLAAFFALLQRYSGQDDLAVGTPTMRPSGQWLRRRARLLHEHGGAGRAGRRPGVLPHPGAPVAPHRAGRAGAQRLSAAHPRRGAAPPEPRCLGRAVQRGLLLPQLGPRADRVRSGPGPGRRRAPGGRVRPDPRPGRRPRGLPVHAEVQPRPVRRADDRAARGALRHPAGRRDRRPRDAGRRAGAADRAGVGAVWRARGRRTIRPTRWSGNWCAHRPKHARRRWRCAAPQKN